MDLLGTEGDDTLLGSAEDDTVSGLAGNDSLRGNAGNDVLNGGAGTDLLEGGAGQDTFVFDSGIPLEIDRITDLGALDVLQFAAGVLATRIQVGADGAALAQGQLMLGTPSGGITRLYVGADASLGADVVIELLGNFSVGQFSTEYAAYGSLLFDPSLNEPRVLTGTPDSDTLQGGNRDDTLSGLAGDDALSGAQGDDVLDGGDGSDTLRGSDGQDTLRGGSSYDFLAGGPGDDLLDGGADSDWVFYDDASGSVNVNLATGLASGADGNDTLVGIEDLSGSAFDDVLTGDAGDNTLDGGFGNDTLIGGAGQDTAAYWSAEDSVNLNLATGIASGGRGQDTLVGIEILVGSSFDDVLVGDAQANRLEGAGGRDTLSGGAGADTFVLDGGNPLEIDRITDLGNGDTLQFNGGELAIAILRGDDASALAAGQVMLGTPSAGLTRVYVGTNTSPGADLTVELAGSFVVEEFTTQFTTYGALLFDATLNQPRTLTGTTGDDTLQGGNRDDTLLGGAGSDDLNGSLGNDLLNGDEGYDLLTGGLGDDTLNGGADSDWAFYVSATGPVNVNLATGRASGADGNDTLSGIEHLYGSAFDDVLTGDGEDNTLNGLAGNDTLAGGVGIDEAVYWDASGSVNVNLSTGRASGADGDDRLTGIENLYGSSFADVLSGDGANNYIAGSSGDDRLDGGAGADSLDGGEGDDRLDGGEGDDELQGGDGHDTLIGGAGVDTVLFNGPELNYLITSLGPGAWRIEDRVGLEGIDTLSGIEHLSFVIVGTLDGSTLAGGEGFDIASYEEATSAVTVDLDQGQAVGTAGRNGLSSIEGAIGSANFGDTLIGNTGDNQLEGLGGNDRLDGGAGSDDLDGGAGADTLIGGPGADRYVVDDELDQVIELNNALGMVSPTRPGLDLGQNIDKVVASVSFSLGSFVENLELAGAAGDLSGNGNSLDNVLTGNEGNNRFVGAGGNDTIDGQAGVDTAVYSGARAGYQLSRGADTFSVQSSGGEGTDTLRATERLEFADLGVALDTLANQAGGQTALLIGAVLGASALTGKPAVVGSVLSLFDQGFTLRELSGAVMRLPIWDALAGGSDNTSVARYLLGNVLGTAPDAALLAAATGYMANTEQGDLLWLLAAHPVNQAQVNLVGLAQTGLEFSL